MASRRPPAPLGWAMLLVVVASSCLTCLNGVAAEEAEANCTSHTNCTSCLSDTSNVTCFWLECKEPNQSGCRNQTHEGCTTLEQCLPLPTSNTTTPPPRNVTSPPTPGNTSTISPQVTTTSASASVTTAAVPGTPSPHKSTFDASSFIGGIVLVLGLQAVIFFLYKFCKSKDQNYHTL